MTKRLLYILLAVALAMVAALTAFTVPAAAEKRTIYVKLATGKVVPVTVDVPPGTPVDKIPLPGTPTTPTQPTTPAKPAPQQTTR